MTHGEPRRRLAGGDPAPSGESAARLDAARLRIDALDAELVRLAAERLAAAAEAGLAKAEMGLSLVDYRREKDVLGRVREAASRHGLDPSLAEDLVLRLIVESTSRQERERVARGTSGAGRRAVVVGGAGRMGRWIERFLKGAGHETFVLDPADPIASRDAETHLAKADLVLLCVPPSQAARLYEEWTQRPPRGIVADLCSVKTPLAAALRRFQAAGGRAASFHPMFGPTANVLRGADIVLCKAGDPDAEAAVGELFAPTAARLVEVALDDHDRLMADALTLAHATAITFAASLPEGPLTTRGTTFRRLQDVAASVVEESPQVYYEIQAGNPHSPAALRRLEDSVARLRAIVEGGDEVAFHALLEDSRRRLAASKAGAPQAVVAQGRQDQPAGRAEGDGP